jgi:hypothetical protein
MLKAISLSPSILDRSNILCVNTNDRGAMSAEINDGPVVFSLFAALEMRQDEPGP